MSLSPATKNRLYGRRWKAYARAYLAKHPLCASCPRPNAATVVDHIRPHKGNLTLFHDQSNHQALCKRCHDIKTATSDGGFGNRVQGSDRVDTRRIGVISLISTADSSNGGC